MPNKAEISYKPQKPYTVRVALHGAYSTKLKLDIEDSADELSGITLVMSKAEVVQLSRDILSALQDLEDKYHAKREGKREAKG